MTDIIPQPNNKQQVQKLNNLESQAWLYEGILERLGADPSANHEKIARTLEALEYKRSEILQELEPRKPRRYRFLAKIQDSVRTLLASQAEKDYEHLQKIVTNLVLFTRTRPPSQLIISELINKLATEIANNKNQISPYRLRLAYSIDELIKLLSTKIILNYNGSKTDSDYELLVNELRSRLNLLSKEFNNLLRNKQESKNELNRRTQEISSLSNNISDLHRQISNRDADIAPLQENIQNMRRAVQDKQAQINTLQNSISDLRRDTQSATELNEEKQKYINHLQTHLSQLSQQKSDLQKRIEALSADAQSKVSMIEQLQNEKSQLNNQKAELEQQYLTLYQDYQQQQNEIANLKAQLSQVNRSQSSTYSSLSQTQQTTKPIATKSKISVKEYGIISNKSDYEYVEAYSRKDGTPVRGYYRRRRSK